MKTWARVSDNMTEKKKKSKILLIDKSTELNTNQKAELLGDETLGSS